MKTQNMTWGEAMKYLEKHRGIDIVNNDFPIFHLHSYKTLDNGNVAKHTDLVNDGVEKIVDPTPEMKDSKNWRVK